MSNIEQIIIYMHSTRRKDIMKKMNISVLQRYILVMSLVFLFTTILYIYAYKQSIFYLEKEIQNDFLIVYNSIAEEIRSIFLKQERYINELSKEIKELLNENRTDDVKMIIEFEVLKRKHLKGLFLLDKNGNVIAGKGDVSEDLKKNIYLNNWIFSNGKLYYASRADGYTLLAVYSVEMFNTPLIEHVKDEMMFDIAIFIDNETLFTTDETIKKDLSCNNIVKEKQYIKSLYCFDRYAVFLRSNIEESYPLLIYLKKIAFIHILVVLIILLAFGCGLYFDVIRPIRKISNNLMRVNRGEYTISRIKHLFDDEIRNLELSANLLSSFIEIDRTMITEKDLKKASKRIIEVICAFTDSDYGFIEIYPKRDNPLFVFYAKNKDACKISFEHKPMISKLRKMKEDFIVIKEPKIPAEHVKIREALIIKLKNDTGILGVGKMHGCYSSKEIDAMKFISVQLSIAIERFLSRIELEKAYKRISELDALKTAIISNISHELKTPITNIKGIIDLAIKENDIETIREDLKVAKRNVLRLLNLIDDIISFANLFRGVVKKFKEVSLRDLAEEAVKEKEKFAKEKNVKVVLKVLDDVYIRGDRELLKRAFLNLIDNGIKFNRENGILEIIIKKENGNAIITFKDTGIGIPEDKIDDIFEPFMQLDYTARRKYGGTGIGLALVKAVVDVHRGKVKVKSKVGEGTEFTLVFPYQ